MGTKDVITEKRRVWLQTSFQAALPAVVTAVEEDVFWTTLPREAGQVLVLQENDRVRMGVSLNDGFYTAETEVKAVGDGGDKFYGLAKPAELVRTQHRQFMRLSTVTDALFTAGELQARTVLVNVSAGGLMVYLVPDLQRIIQSGGKMRVKFSVDNAAFDLPVHNVWQKSYDHVPFAGFQFLQIPPALRLKMAELCLLKQPQGQ
ncbi:MAG: PilZ domain-containing protein [Thermoanaerobacterales bacterium]|nr:PilZ domain-containing protein [Thermoanaerobacterales bacterium]